MWKYFGCVHYFSNVYPPTFLPLEIRFISTKPELMVIVGAVARFFGKLHFVFCGWNVCFHDDKTPGGFGRGNIVAVFFHRRKRRSVSAGILPIMLSDTLNNNPSRSEATKQTNLLEELLTARRRSQGSYFRRRQQRCCSIFKKKSPF